MSVVPGQRRWKSVESIALLDTNHGTARSFLSVIVESTNQHLFVFDAFFILPHDHLFPDLG